jgi:hypothetical protein
MRREFRIFLAVASLAGVCLFAISAWAQGQQQSGDKASIERRMSDAPAAPGAPSDHLVWERHMQGPPMPPPPPGAPGDFIFLSTEMSFGGKVVKGAPYSAEAVTESTQTLVDGNRIINKSSATLYRDSEGRTRREQTLRAIGPFAGEAPQTIFIHDPVAGTSYTLDPQQRIARKMPPLRFKKMANPPEGVKPEIEKPIAEKRAVEHGVTVVPFEVHGEAIHKAQLEGGMSIGFIGPQGRNARTESLGKQVIEGVEAEGSRTIVTIAAGEIGNERPIEILSERWYSPDLQAVVMSKHSDPRFGENSYRLININRNEPARTLFEVPGDYTVKEGPPLAPEPLKMRMRKPE